MSRTFTALGASIIVFAALGSGVEAKSVFYEVNGQRYSYDTSNRRQTAAARKVIEAAKAAEIAKATAAAERASNPLVAVFGSQAQREAEAAQAQLNQIVAEQEQAAAVSKSQRALQAAKEERSATSGDGKADDPTRVTEREKAAATGTPTAQSGMPKLADSAEAVQSKGASRVAIRSVFLDAETGIKTIIRSDGSIHEELFDQDILSRLDPESRSASVASDVPDVSQPTPDDVTGSISFRETTLEMNSGTVSHAEPLAN
jgi:NADH dehydrogenase/NADH:ubiquinone oxidoreductase subunit G